MKKKCASFISPKKAMENCFMDMRRAKARGEFKGVTKKHPMFNPAISFHVFKLKPPIDMEAVDDCSSSESETECDSSSSSLPPIKITDATALPATISICSTQVG